MVLGTSTPSIANDIEIASHVKSINPSIITILVGTHASSTAREIIQNNSCIDFVARREYDITVCEIVRSIDNANPLENVLGITSKHGSSDEIIETADFYISDLDEIPFASQV